MDAQNPHMRFNPERFEAEMEQFIVVQAGLSPTESAVFFPLYKEMQDKQRIKKQQIGRASCRERV